MSGTKPTLAADEFEDWFALIMTPQPPHHHRQFVKLLAQVWPQFAVWDYLTTAVGDEESNECTQPSTLRSLRTTPCLRLIQ